MTTQIGCDRRNPSGRLTLSFALRYSSSTTFVASSFFLDQNPNPNGGAHAGFRMPSSQTASMQTGLWPGAFDSLPVETLHSAHRR